MASNIIPNQFENETLREQFRKAVTENAYPFDRFEDKEIALRAFKALVLIERRMNPTFYFICKMIISLTK